MIYGNISPNEKTPHSRLMCTPLSRHRKNPCENELLKIKRGAFLMVIKGQKFKHYDFEFKKKAIQMLLSGKSRRLVAKELGIHDFYRLKDWMRKYRKYGEYGLMDKRGRRGAEYVDRERYIKRLEMEVEVLKKYVELTREVEQEKSNTR
jgi:transposase